MQSARVADIETGEQQVYSQLMQLIEGLGTDSSFIIDFGEDEKGMQSVLDGLGLHRIPDAENTVNFLGHSSGQADGQYGVGKDSTGGKIMHMLGDLPVTKSLQAMLAGDWYMGPSSEAIPSSQSMIGFRLSVESDINIVVSCLNNAELTVPDWDYEYSKTVLRKGSAADKILYLGSMIRTDDSEPKTSQKSDEDNCTLPHRSYSMEIHRIGPWSTPINGSIFYPFSAISTTKVHLGVLKYINGNLEGNLKTSLTDNHEPALNAAPVRELHIPSNIILGEN